MLGFVGLLPPAEVMPNAKKLAVAALEIDRDLAEGHASLANVLKLYDHDWAAAEREYLQALRLNPNYVHGYRGYAALLAASGRFAESAIQIGHAHDLDPLSVLVSMEMAWNAFIARDYGSAIQHAQRTMELEPESPSAQYILGLACEQVRRFGEASAAIERSLAGSHRHPSGLAALGHVFAVSGRRQEALRLRDELREVARRQYVAPFWHALLDAGLGDEGSALAELERSCDECDLWLIWLNTDPRFNSLRAAPSFQRLLRRARFLEQARSA
jgi:tetratricopeptide (TPR) repeat protein